MAKKYGKYIREYRTKAGLKQEELAKELNVSPSTVSSWETDRTRVDAETYEKLSRILACDINQLYGLDVTSKSETSFAIPSNSKPYLDMRYTLPKWRLALLITSVLFTFLSPLLDQPWNQIFIILWLVYGIVITTAFTKNSRKNIATKYYHEHQTLYYKQTLTPQQQANFKKETHYFKGLLLVSLNISVLFPFSITQTYVDDPIYPVIFVFMWLFLNGLFIYTIIYDAKPQHTGNEINHSILNVNFYLGRYKLLLIGVTLLYLFQYLVLTVIEHNPYQSVPETMVYALMTITLILVYVLYQMYHYYYANYTLIVKTHKP